MLYLKIVHEVMPFRDISRVRSLRYLLWLWPENMAHPCWFYDKNSTGPEQADVHIHIFK